MKVEPINVEFVDKMGSDLSVVNAARVSFAKVSSEFSEKDAKLVGYLARHGHWTPFAHTAISLRIKAPIFVARQLVKHQIGLTWNEVSRRYVEDEPSFYFPEVWRGRPEGSVKQGSGDSQVDLTAVGVSGEAPPHPSGWEASLEERLCGDIEDILYTYHSLLKAGVAPEQARMILPLNTMTEWIWTGNVMSFARVCKQRLDPHAQAETREVAEGIYKIVKQHFPVSFEALMENR